MFKTIAALSLVALGIAACSSMTSDPQVDAPSVDKPALEPECTRQGNCGSGCSGKKQLCGDGVTYCVCDTLSDGTVYGTVCNNVTNDQCIPVGCTPQSVSGTSDCTTVRTCTCVNKSCPETDVGVSCALK